MARQSRGEGAGPAWRASFDARECPPRTGSAEHTARLHHTVTRRGTKQQMLATAAHLLLVNACRYACQKRPAVFVSICSPNRRSRHTARRSRSPAHGRPDPRGAAASRRAAERQRLRRCARVRRRSGGNSSAGQHEAAAGICAAAGPQPQRGRGVPSAHGGAAARADGAGCVGGARNQHPARG